MNMCIFVNKTNEKIKLNLKKKFTYRKRERTGWRGQEEKLDFLEYILCIDLSLALCKYSLNNKTK